MAFVDVRGTSIFFEATGEGEPLVLVHGGFLDHTMWMLNVPILAERFWVVTADGRGHGQSSGSIGDDPFVGPDDLAALVEELDLVPAHLAGQSGGGLQILHLAARRPDLFRSMSLHEPVAVFDEEFSAAREAWEAAASQLRAGDVESGIKTFVEMIGGDWSLFPEPFKAMFRQNAHNFTGTWFGDLSHPMWRVPAELRDFPHPVQLTKGDQSPRFFHVGIERIADLMPRAEIVTIEGGGHGAMLDRPAEYAAALTDFIERTCVTPASRSGDNT